jgi:hypothetical protein
MRMLALILALAGCSAAQIYTGSTSTSAIAPPATPNLGGLTNNNATYTDTALGVTSIGWRCTDSVFVPGKTNSTFSAGLGGSGDAVQLFNATATATHFLDNGGSGFITMMDPVGHTCGDSVLHKVVTADKNLTNPGSSSTSYNFAAGTFDWLNPNVWYTVDHNPDTGNQTIGEKYTFANLSTGTFNDNGHFVDFAFALPLGANVSAWQANHAYTAGTYIKFTASFPDWSTGAHALGDLIVPLTSNPSGCAFKVTLAGTSSGTTPTNWGATCGGNTVTDSGGVKWRGIVGPPVFIFQLTSASGTSGSSTPSFVPANNHPDLMTGPGIGATPSDNGLTWTNTGPAIPPQWSSFAGISQDATKLCQAMSSDSYGFNGIYTTFNADQGNGIYAACYNILTNIYVLLNTATGWVSQSTCSGGSGYNCAGGSWIMAPVGTLSAITGVCGYRIHNMKGNATMDYPIVASQAGLGCTPASPELVWRPFLPFNSTASGQYTLAGLNHWAMGNTHVLNVGQNSIFGLNTGAYTQLFDLTNPQATPVITWQPTCGSAPIPPCQFNNAYDSHLGIPGISDITGVACGTVFNFATLFPVPTVPWQGEEVCVSLGPTWTAAGPVDPNAKLYRFTHTFNDGANPGFATQFAISQVSQFGSNGQFIAWGSDWGCTLGTTAGGSPASELCGPPWISGFAFPLNSLVSPVSNQSGSGSQFDVFKITNIGSGTSGTSFPGFSTPNVAFASCTTVNCTLTDNNGMVYTDQGPTNNGRGDVFIVQVAPAPNATVTAPAAGLFAKNGGVK